MAVDVKLSGKRFFIGLFGAAVSFAICLLLGGSLLKSIVMVCAYIVVSSLNISIEDRFTLPIILSIILISGFVSLLLTQFVLGEGLASVQPICVFLGYCCCLFIIGFVYFLYPNIRIAASVGIGLFLMLSTANYFVYSFRGTELTFVDFFSIATATNVVSQYSYQPTAPMVYAWVLYLLYIYALGAIKTTHISWKTPKHFVICLPAVCAVVLLGIMSDNVEAYHFGNHGTYNNGYILNFYLTIDEVFIKKPEQYAPEAAERIAESYTDTQSQNAQVLPSIIAIMDESYSDLSVLGSEINTDIQISPFINSLTDNTIKGYALTSAFGGRTANSEFEFLTGATMGFLPNGSIAYQQFIHEGQYSIVTYLEGIGYETAAVHPYIETGWMRNTVWPTLGFDRCSFLSDFPQTDLVRELVSDQEVVDKIIETYENRDTASPLFYYAVTMQNHSGYDYTGTDFETSIHLVGYSQEYPDVEQYLSLLQKTDQAIENLIMYFSQVDEPVVVLFYGDHLPSLNQDFYNEVHGGEFSTLDEQMMQYKVPFFIWCNYDIEAYNVECSSLNYLSNYLYEAAGIDPSAYSQFLKDMESHIPAVNLLGYYSVANDCFLPYSSATGGEKEWLDKYTILQYNALFDEENRSSIYSIN